MSVAPTLIRNLDECLGEVQPAAIAVRRHLHLHPEVSWQEAETRDYLEGVLAEAGLKTQTVAGTGLVVDLGTGTGQRVLYRGDIDALPIHEVAPPGGTKLISKNAGVSHACGHDLHAAVAAGLALALKKMEGEIPGRVRIIFQPAEEILPSGAEAMIKAGVLEGVKYAFALHSDPTRDVGTVGVRVGPFTSTSDAFDLKVIGEPGHSARPHLARDAMIAAAGVIQALYHLVGQRVNPLEPAVLNIGKIRGGDVKNVLAGEVTLEGVVRTLLTDTRERLHSEILRVAELAAAVHGCRVELAFQMGAPPICNPAHLHVHVKGAAVDVLGESCVQEIPQPSTGAEDFGHISAAVPSYMMRLGVRTPGHPTTHLHTPGFDLDERAVGVGMRVMARALMSALVADPDASDGWSGGGQDG